MWASIPAGIFVWTSAILVVRRPYIPSSTSHVFGLRTATAISGGPRYSAVIPNSSAVRRALLRCGNIRVSRRASHLRQQTAASSASEKSSQPNPSRSIVDSCPVVHILVQIWRLLISLVSYCLLRSSFPYDCFSLATSCHWFRHHSKKR
jgi:hypothetical protein